MEAPWATIGHAQTVAAAGDTVYFRAGTYAYTSGLKTCASGTDTINAILLSSGGKSGAPIKYWAYPGETPVFDFSGIKDSCRVTGFRVTGSWMYFKGLEVMGVPQNNMLNHESWGIWISGSNNTFELINTHNNMGPGLFIQEGSNNLVLNCDSHDNYDPLTSNGAGQSADGFGCHIGAGGTGNVFRGCRAWWNSDDGWDFIQAAEVVTVENSWAWYNGYLPGTTTSAPAGNGNGFKGGGYGEPPTNVPASPPHHIVRNDLSVMNKESGFYANHEPVADYWYNNTSYGNHPDFNLLGDPANVGILRNNIAFSGTLLSNNTGSGVDDSFNSWDTNLGVTVSNADFQGVSVTSLSAPRQADGSLPEITDFHLVAGSDLIDKGTDVGLPFNGKAPDLGCFETGAPLGGAGGSGGTVGAGAASGTGGAPSGGTSNGGNTNGGTNSAGATSGGATSNAGTANGGATSAGGSSSGGATSSGGSGMGTAGSTASSGGTSSSNGGATATSAGTSSTVSAAGIGNGAEPSSADDSAGCSCRIAEQRTSSRAWLALGLFGLASLRRRKARR
ncbi:MAG TPA: MYXO-CTERM sorting domain-containing protein [Polyangiaceae bacterium]|nr:MYXO-CTERM sorting domain-containing protein [Polyangiaceae bacterium]